MTSDEMDPPEAASPPPPRGHRQRPGKAGSAAVAWLDGLAEATTLFERTSHNPSWRSVQAAVGAQRELIDFCVPVNPYFPPPELLQEITDHLPQILKYYPDDALVHQRAIGVTPSAAASRVSHSAMRIFQKSRFTFEQPSCSKNSAADARRAAAGVCVVCRFVYAN
jgi:hypothetical protein